MGNCPQAPRGSLAAFAEVLKTAYINTHELACLILLIVIHINVKLKLIILLQTSVYFCICHIIDGAPTYPATLSVAQEVIERDRNVNMDSTGALTTLTSIVFR